MARDQWLAELWFNWVNCEAYHNSYKQPHPPPLDVIQPTRNGITRVCVCVCVCVCVRERVWVWVCVWVCVCVCVCVCVVWVSECVCVCVVCVCERERERESVCVCVCVRERERVWVCVRERECECESVWVSVCVRERESVCVWERECESVCQTRWKGTGTKWASVEQKWTAVWWDAFRAIYQQNKLSCPVSVTVLTAHSLQLYANIRHTLYIFIINNARKKLWAYKVLSSVKSWNYQKGNFCIHVYSITLKNVSQMHVAY